MSALRTRAAAVLNLRKLCVHAACGVSFHGQTPPLSMCSRAPPTATSAGPISRGSTVIGACCMYGLCVCVCHSRWLRVCVAVFHCVCVRACRYSEGSKYQSILIHPETMPGGSYKNLNQGDTLTHEMGIVSHARPPPHSVALC